MLAKAELWTFLCKIKYCINLWAYFEYLLLLIGLCLRNHYFDFNFLVVSVLMSNISLLFNWLY